jgi:hypothetical protein
MHAGHASNGSQRISFYQCSNHLFPLCNAQFIHASNMLERSSNVKQEMKEVYFLFHLFAAALRAISFRFRADNEAALALPPFNPPSRPKATAAGFLPPVDCATMPAAI